ADLNAIWRQNITLFAIGILQKANARIAIRIVFNSFDYSRNIVLVTFEINDAISPLVSTAFMSNSKLPLIITPGRLLERTQQGFFWTAFCDVRKIGHRHKTSSC